MSEIKIEDRKNKNKPPYDKSKKPHPSDRFAKKDQKEDQYEALRQQILDCKVAGKFKEAIKLWAQMPKESRQVSDYHLAIYCCEKAKDYKNLSFCYIDLSVMLKERKDYLEKGMASCLKCPDDDEDIQKLFAFALMRRARMTGKKEDWEKAGAYHMEIGKITESETYWKNAQKVDEGLDLQDFNQAIKEENYDKASLLLNQAGRYNLPTLHSLREHYLSQADLNNAEWVSRQIVTQTNTEEDWRKVVELQKELIKKEEKDGDITVGKECGRSERKKEKAENLGKATIKLAVVTNKEEDWSEAIRINKEIKNDKSLAFCCRKKAEKTGRLEDWSEAIFYNEATGNSVALAMCWEGKAKATGRAEDWNEAINCHKENRNSRSLAICCERKAKVTGRKEDWDEAIYYHKSNGNFKSLSFCYEGKAKATGRAEDWDEAIYCHERNGNSKWAAFCRGKKAESTGQKPEWGGRRRSDIAPAHFQPSMFGGRSVEEKKEPAHSRQEHSRSDASKSDKRIRPSEAGHVRMFTPRVGKKEQKNVGSITPRQKHATVDPPSRKSKKRKRSDPPKNTYHG